MNRVRAVSFYEAKLEMSLRMVGVYDVGVNSNLALHRKDIVWQAENQKRRRYRNLVWKSL